MQPNQRVMAGALLLLVMNFIGLGLGPTWVGAASDWFAAHGHANCRFRLALYTLTPFYVIAIILFLFLARRLATEQRLGERQREGAVPCVPRIWRWRSRFPEQQCRQLSRSRRALAGR